MNKLSIGVPALPGNSHDPGALIEAINNHSPEHIGESIAASYVRPAGVIYNWEAWLYDRKREFPTTDDNWSWQHEYAWEMLERAERKIAEVKQLMQIKAPHARQKPTKPVTKRAK